MDTIFLADAKGFFVFHKGANYFMISDAESYEKAGPSNTCVVAMLLPNTKIKDGDHAEIKYSPNWRQFSGAILATWDALSTSRRPDKCTRMKGLYVETVGK